MTGDPRAPLPAPRRSPGLERRFGDAEVAAILSRVASRDSSAELPAPSDATLADLMAAAAEAGLDPAEVRRAAALLPPPPPGVAGAALGAPDHREARALLEGARLPADARALARAAERALGREGRVSATDPGRFEWEERHLGGRTAVKLTEDGGALEVRVSADRAGTYAGLWLGGLVGWALLSALTPLGALPLLGKALALLLTPFLLARPLWVRSDRAVRARLERAVLDLARAAEEQVGEGGATPALPPPA